MQRTIIILCILTALVSCGKAKSINPLESVSDTIQLTDSFSFVEKQIYVYTCNDGHIRKFYDIYWLNNYSTYLSREMDHRLGVQDSADTSTNRFLPLLYQRYDEPDYFAYIGGCPAQFYYTSSPDKKNLYIVTRVYANSDGWVSEYQLFKIDCEPTEVKFICECAAMAVTDSGFIVVQARLTNEDEVTCTAEEIWVMHDEYLDWDGNVLRVSDEEYDYDTMVRMYKNEVNSYLKGFRN